MVCELYLNKSVTKENKLRQTRKLNRLNTTIKKKLSNLKIMTLQHACYRKQVFNIKSQMEKDISCNQ